MVIVIVGLIAVALGVAVFTLLGGMGERAVAREGLELLDDYGVPTGVIDHREKELSSSVLSRLMPSTGGVLSIGHKLTPAGYVERAKHKIVRSGDRSPNAVDRFLVVRVLTAIAAPILFLVIFFAAPFKGFMAFALAGLVAAVVFLLPDMRLNRAVEARELRITRDLPSVLDLLTISVEAGLGFDQAVDRVVANVPGPLTDEFRRMLGETRAGMSRSDAIRAMEARIDLPNVRSFLLAIIQADTFGVSIGRVLRAQAEEARIKRRQEAQEMAMKAPVKMLLPIVFCIFPALFVVVLVPAIINIVNELG